jgi:hypothetical protein
MGPHLVGHCDPREQVRDDVLEQLHIINLGTHKHDTAHDTVACRSMRIHVSAQVAATNTVGGCWHKGSGRERQLWWAPMWPVSIAGKQNDKRTKITDILCFRATHQEFGEV